MDPTFDLLAGHCGEQFTFVTSVTPVTVTLDVARPNPDDRPGGSLLFSGPADQPMTQGTYPIRHATLGEGLLFVVPVKEDAGTRTYEAVFG